MNAGGYGTARAQSRLRAAVNARLEEISFRTGLIAATIGLVALFAIAAAGVFAATLSIGNQAIAAAGALSSASAPTTTPTVTASAPPATYPQASSRPQASSPPQASHPVTAATTSPQAAAGSRPRPRAAGAQAAPRYSGQAGYGSHGSWYGDNGSWYGGGSWYGHGSWYGGGWPGYGGDGFPGHGFGFARPGSRNLYRVCVPQNGTNPAGFCPKRGTSSRKSHLGDVPICPARYFSDD